MARPPSGPRRRGSPTALAGRAPTPPAAKPTTRRRRAAARHGTCTAPGPPHQPSTADVRLYRMAQTVRGVISRKKGDPVEVVDVVIPDPGPGEVVVDVIAC